MPTTRVGHIDVLIVTITHRTTEYRGRANEHNASHLPVAGTTETQEQEEPQRICSPGFH